MNESFYYDASSTPANSMFLRPNENGNGTDDDVRSSRYEYVPASTSASTSGSRAGGPLPLPLPLPADSSQEWVEETGSASSGDTSELVQASTVRYRVKSPKKDVRMNSTGSGGRSGRAGGAGSTPKSSRIRKDSSSTQSTPRASTSSTPNVALKRRNRQPRETAEGEPAGSSFVWGRATPRGREMEASYGPSWQFSWLSHTLRPLRLIVSLIFSLLGIALSPVANALSAAFLVLFIVVALFYGIRSQLGTLTSSLLLPASTLLLSPFSGVAYLHPTSLKTAWCANVGLGCEAQPLPLARLARTVSDQAIQAHDIFTAVVALGNPANLGLHHTEVWELAVAVKATSGLENKDRLGNTLKELGDMTRDVKDAMTGLNAQGINSFSWILHEFSRIEKTLELLQTKPSRYKAEDVSRQLDALFEHLTSDLSSLLSEIQGAIPLAARASDLGGRVMFELGTEHARLNREREDMPLWRKLAEINSFSSRQLSRDLQLTGDSVSNMKTTRKSLENARSFLIGYRDQVSYFKASVVGFHISDHGLDPEDEVAALRSIMSKFEQSVDEAKRSVSPAGARAGAQQQMLDGSEP